MTVCGMLIPLACSLLAIS